MQLLYSVKQYINDRCQLVVQHGIIVNYLEKDGWGK